MGQIDDIMRDIAKTVIGGAVGLGIAMGSCAAYNRIDQYRTRNKAEILLSEQPYGEGKTELTINKGQDYTISYTLNDEDGLAKAVLYQNGEKIEGLDMTTWSSTQRMQTRLNPRLEEIPGEYQFELRGIDRKNNPTSIAKATLKVLDVKYDSLPNTLK
ncbi:Uncharacterised protein [uncultured archaeon]|nr:Uncharacterised protein [uncultured archaeon]